MAAAQDPRTHDSTFWLSRWVFEYRTFRTPAAYSAELDGLRGVAVVVVVLFHLGLPGFSGGYLGVDAFFVISGYLITSIIAESIRKGTFSYSMFLLKRAKRLLPALAAMALTTTAVGWVVFNSTELSRYGDSLLGVGTYTSNFVFLNDDGYFDQPTATTPLLHTWSLAVEEQFYVLFPLMFLVLVRFFDRAKGLLLTLMVLGSLLLWLAFREFELSGFLADAAFYLLPTRAWEFGAGAILALKIGWISSWRSRSGASDRLALLGAVAYCVSLVVGSFWPDRGFPSVIAVISVMVMIAFAPQSTLGRVLATRMLAGLGSLSYGLYLWHFPIIAYFKLFAGEDELSFLATAGILFATLVAALLSLRFIENPVRLGDFSPRRMLGLVLAFVTALATLGALSKAPERALVAETQAALALQRSQWINFSGLNERVFQLERLEAGIPDGVATVVVGSSRLMEVSSELSGEPVLNLSVSGASVEDIYALGLGGLATTGAGRVVIGLDPWLVNESAAQERWRALESNFRFWESHLTMSRPLGPVGPGGISSDGDSLSVIANVFLTVNVSGTRLVSLDGRPGFFDKKAQDGAHIPSLASSNRTEAEIIAGFPDLISYAGMDAFSLSIERLDAVRNLISYLTSNDIDVTLVLTPYHPLLYSEFSTIGNGFVEAEGAFREIASDTEVTLVGSYDPAVSSCSQSEFYDGMHPTAACMAKVLTVASERQ